jgi:hypothetical protein
MDRDIKTLMNFLNDKSLKIYKDDDNRIIIEGNIFIYNTEYTKFPVKIHKLIGDLYWHGDTDGFKKSSLSTLKNFPDIVEGSVYIQKNPKLTSLKYAPVNISGTLQCNLCNITDISDSLKFVGKSLILSNNPLTDIKPLENIYVGSNINLINCKINTENITTKNDSSIIITERITNDIF